jgi:HEAT repeat protein
MSLFGPPNIENMKAKRNIQGLIKALTYQKDAHTRELAATALGELRNALAVQPLIPVLKDGNENVRQSAVEALGKIGGTAVVEPLIPVLKDGNENVRQSAVEALGKIGGTSVIEPLINVLAEDNEKIHQAAATALVIIGAPAKGPLSNALNHQIPGVRSRAAEVLVKVLVERLEHYTFDANMRSSDLSERDRRVGDSASDALLIDGDHSQLNLASAYIEGGSRQRSVIKETIYKERTSTAREMGKIGVAALEPLIALFKNDKEDVRWAATVALGTIGAQLEDITLRARAVEPLLAALEDRDNYVRQAAVEALGKIGGPRAVEPLINLLNRLRKNRVS